MTEKNPVIARCECDEDCGRTFELPKELEVEYPRPVRSWHVTAADCPYACPEPWLIPFDYGGCRVWEESFDDDSDADDDDY